MRGGHLLSTVPVEIRDVDPQYPYAQVGCNIRAADNTPLGLKNVTFDIRPNNRPYSASITVPVDMLPGTSASAVTNYVCVLSFCKTTQDSTCVRPDPTIPSKPQPEPGTPFTPQVDGPIR